MKKYIILSLLLLATVFAQAQGISDGLRYGQTNLVGTARYNAMAGAFGALGGDLSSINSNPAGSVIFANNQVGLTVSDADIRNSSNYFNSKTNKSKNSFDLNQAGGVFVFNNEDRNSKWKKFAVAINYENASNLNNQVFVSGTNPTNSIDSYFLSYANGVQKNILDTYFFDEMSFREQQAFLGYESFILEANSSSPSNTSYFTNVSALGGNYIQTNSVNSQGNNGKVSFNFSSQYNEKLSIGINLNSHFSDFIRSSRFFETNRNPYYTTGATVDVIRFNNDLETRASGFSMQIGFIYKPVKEFRFGLAYESPTWYRVEERLTQSIVTSGVGFDAANPTSYRTATVDPRYTTVFEPYDLRTPSKTTGSAAYVFGKKGLISADVSFKEYSGTVFSPKNQFTAVNNAISNSLNLSKEVRIGAEYKIQKFSLRGGYRWEESPFKLSKTYGDLTAYSGGLGYNFASTKLDISYTNANRWYNEGMFSQGLTDKVNISETRNTFVLTLLFEL